MKRKIFRLFVLTSIFCFLPVSVDAGLLTWLFGPSDYEKYQMDTGSNITEYARSTYIAKLKIKASVVPEPAIQIGKLESNICQTVTDAKWYGYITVRVKADYSATFGLPYDLIEKGIRIEKDYTTTGLVVIVASPIPLSVAVDTSSAHLADREGSPWRTWDVVPELQLEAQKSLTSLATMDARRRCRDEDVLEMTRAVVLDLVLDMAGELYSKKVKRTLTTRTIVIFEHEINNFRRRTAPLTPFEIDTMKSDSLHQRNNL